MVDALCRTHNFLPATTNSLHLPDRVRSGDPPGPQGTGPPGAHLWAYWDAIDHPVLVVPGRDSDFLLSYISREMARRNPHAIVHDVPGCGHAPTLMPSDQVEVVAAFLTSGPETREAGSAPDH